RGDAHAQISAHIALAEAGQHAGDAAAVEALCASDDDRDRWTLARGRLALCDPQTASGTSPAGSIPSPAPAPPARPPLPGDGSLRSLGDATAALARACAEVAVRATDGDRLERAFRGHAIAAQLAHRARDAALALREAERARVAHAAWVAATAPAFRAAVDGDPAVARL